MITAWRSIAVARVRARPVCAPAEGNLRDLGMSEAPTLRGERVVLVPVREEQVSELRRILATAEVRLRWRDEASSPGWPFDDSSVTRFAG